MCCTAYLTCGSQGDSTHCWKEAWVTHCKADIVHHTIQDAPHLCIPRTWGQVQKLHCTTSGNCDKVRPFVSMGHLRMTEQYRHAWLVAGIMMAGIYREVSGLSHCDNTSELPSNLLQTHLSQVERHL